MGLCVTKATSKNEPIEELSIATVDPTARKTGKEFPGWLYGVLFVPTLIILDYFPRKCYIILSKIPILSISIMR